MAMVGVRSVLGSVTAAPSTARINAFCAYQRRWGTEVSDTRRTSACRAAAQAKHHAQTASTRCLYTVFCRG